jgi:ADP-heptose:LPS heptosyltransferase
MRSPDPCFLENVRRHIPDCFFVKTVPPYGLRMHVSDFQLNQLHAAGIQSGAAMPVLDSPSGPALVFPKKPVIVLHPGSGGERKCWPLDNYLKLLSLLHSWNEYYFCIILGPAEGDDIFRATTEFILRNRIEAGIIVDKSLSSVAAPMKISSLYIGNDSGTTHLAAALGTPTVAIFGPTDHEIWRPKGKVRIVSSQLPCSPCRGDVSRKCVDVHCLAGVSVESVASAVQDLLNISGQ